MASNHVKDMARLTRAYRNLSESRWHLEQAVTYILELSPPACSDVMALDLLNTARRAICTLMTMLENTVRKGCMK